MANCVEGLMFIQFLIATCLISMSVWAKESVVVVGISLEFSIVAVRCAGRRIFTWNEVAIGFPVSSLLSPQLKSRKKLSLSSVFWKFSTLPTFSQLVFQILVSVKTSWAPKWAQPLISTNGCQHFKDEGWAGGSNNEWCIDEFVYAIGLLSKGELRSVRFPYHL